MEASPEEYACCRYFFPFFGPMSASRGGLNSVEQPGIAWSGTVLDLTGQAGLFTIAAPRVFHQHL